MKCPTYKISSLRNIFYTSSCEYVEKKGSFANCLVF